MQLLAVGSDPEVFFADKKGNPVSAEGLLGGTKNNPKQMEGLPEGYLIQEDNVACEFNIPPCHNADEFNRAIFRGLRYCEKIARSNKLAVKCVPALRFDKKQLDTPHAMQFGCNPDLDVWNLIENEAPNPYTDLRTAAGHVHISWLNPKDEDRILIGRACDLFLGVPSILVTEPSERRNLYGKAGACRFKKYGLEYRTLDNFWVPQMPYRRQVFNMILSMMDELHRNRALWAESLEDIGGEIIKCINSHDKVAARGLCDMYQLNTFDK